MVKKRPPGGDNSDEMRADESCTCSSRPERRRRRPGAEARPVAQRAVEERAGKRADPHAVVGPDRQRGGAGPDREVRVADLGRHGSRNLAATAQMLGELLRHAAAARRAAARGRRCRGRTSPPARSRFARSRARASAGRCRAPGRAARARPSLVATCRSVVVGDRRESPIVSIPSRTRRSSARGPTPGRIRIGNGARNAASRPGRTTVSPPGLRRSEATFATTFEVATPSEHESRVRAADDRPYRLREGAGVVERRARARRGRGSPRRCPVCSTVGTISRTATRPRASSRGKASAAGARTPRCGQRRSASAADIAEWIPKPRAT